MKDEAFSDPSGMKLNQLLERIRSAKDLTANRQSEICSAITTAGKWFNLPLNQILAHPAYLRMLFKSITPATVRVGKKRFANVRSALLFAMRYADIVDKYTYLAPITPEWQKLWDQLPNKYDKRSLSRFFRYVSAQKIKPEQVDEKISKKFHEALVNDSLVKNPDTVHQNACRTWNKLAAEVQEWPNTQLKIPWRRDQYKLPRDTFPQSFLDDVEAYFSRQACDDPFEIEAPPRPLREATIETYREALFRFASALIHSGHDPASITSLTYLVNVKHVEQGLRYMLARTEKQPKRSASHTALLLAKVAKYWVKAKEEDTKTIKEFAKRLFPREDGISHKSRSRLMPFRDESNLARLFLLPGAIVSSVEKGDFTPRRAALRIQQAAAISILSNCPLRVKNLSEIRLDHHLKWSGKNMTGSLILDFTEKEVKNRQFLVFPLPPECAKLICLYIQKYRDDLLMPPSLFLFPGRDPEQCKQRASFAKQITQLTFETIGYKVNPHLFRHLVHLIVLRQFPSAYGMVSRILGHKSLQTTLSNYAHEDVAIAMEVYQDLIADKSTPLLKSSTTKPDEFARSLNQGYFK